MEKRMRIFLLISSIFTHKVTSSCILENSQTIAYCKDLTLQAGVPARFFNSRGSFSSIKRLNIEHSVGSIDAKTLSSLPQLNALHIHRSNIENFASDTLSSISTFEIVKNYFPNLNKNLLISSQLTFLSVMGNLDTIIENEAYANLPKLQKLIISDQEFKRIGRSFLRGPQNLRNFQILYSTINQIDEDAFVDQTDLREISLSGVKSFDLACIKNNQKLTKLLLPGLQDFRISSVIKEHQLEILGLPASILKSLKLNDLKENLVNLRFMFIYVSKDYYKELKNYEPQKVKEMERIYERLNKTDINFELQVLYKSGGRP